MCIKQKKIHGYHINIINIDGLVKTAKQFSIIIVAHALLFFSATWLSTANTALLGYPRPTLRYSHGGSLNTSLLLTASVFQFFYTKVTGDHLA